MQKLPDCSFPYRITESFKHIRGFAYFAKLPDMFKEYQNTETITVKSPFILCEDGAPLLMRNASIVEAIYTGGGRYNHSFDGIFFATSDNTDPNTNGRSYTLVPREKLGPENSAPFPQRMHITLSVNCNLRCRICRPDFITHLPNLPLYTFEKIADECFSYISQLRLDSGGELLLNKDFPVILKKVAEYNVPFFTSSNGMLLTKEKSRLLAESSLHHIQISLDSPVKETLEWIRRGTKFEKIIENVKYLSQIRKEVGRPFHITFHTAIMRENVTHLPDLVRLAKELDIDGVTGCHLYVHHGDGLITPESSCYWDQNQYDDMREQSIEVAREIDSFFYGPSLFSSAGGIESKPPLDCLYPDYGTYIDYNGSVSPCCIALLGTMGNINIQSFEEVWNGKPYQDLRATYNTENPSVSKCKNCLVKSGSSANYQSFFAPEYWPEVKEKLKKITIS